MKAKHREAIDQASDQLLAKRVEALLVQMNPDEKIAQLGSIWVYELFENGKFSNRKAESVIGAGIGQITRLGGASNFKPEEAARFANQIQKYLRENTRLKIPAIIHEECCSGYMTRGATLFPQSIGLAATWNPELVEMMSSVIKTQMRSVGAHQGLSPVLDVTRDARWGRVEETMGEDPYLVACLGCAYVKGLQGNNWKTGVMATGKHFVGYGNSEGGMNWAPAHIPARELHEVFLYPFEAAVKEAKLAAIMNSYAELDGIPCLSSEELFQKLLRERWGFEGVVVSDYFAIAMLKDYHHVAGDKAEAARLAITAGIDVELPSKDCYGAPLKKLLLDGTITEGQLDILVRHVLRMKFLLGLFENPYVEAEKVPQVFFSLNHRTLAGRIARESVVLLKNDNLLPLKADIGSIAVIGPHADCWRNMIGDYAYPCHLEALEKLEGTFETPLPDRIEETEDFASVVTILEGIKAKVSAATRVYFAEGCEVLAQNRQGFAQAVEIAQKADVVVAVVGEKSGLIEGCTTGESKDRADLGLPGVQEELIQEVYKTGTPLVVVLLHGRPLSINWFNEKVAAILTAWFPGEEGGKAVADILFGDANPGGKLPISFPRSSGQIPVFYYHKPSGGRSHWNGNYVNLSAEPLYPFGYGLSYTSFTYEHLRMDKKEVTMDEELTIRVDVYNTGKREGDEVVQLYIHDLECSVTRPVKELKGFKRLTLKPAQKRTVSFSLSPRQLGFYNRAMEFVVEPGCFEVMIGASSGDIRLRDTFEITGEGLKIEDSKRFFTLAF
ncbi:MAG: glycoside hydrolase family 3 N-terminal domain-containing protein [Spirochaetota bacterium]